MAHSVCGDSVRRCQARKLREHARTAARRGRERAVRNAAGADDDDVRVEWFFVLACARMYTRSFVCVQETPVLADVAPARRAHRERHVRLNGGGCRVRPRRLRAA